MKSAHAFAASTVALVVTLAPLLAGRPSDASEMAAPVSAYQVSRPGDAAASCNALVAEIDQISTEVQLRSLARTNDARSLGANRRLQHLTVLVKQRGCAPGRAVLSA